MIFAEMEYKPTGTVQVLARGEYRGYEFVVLNIRGTHPCGYVNIRTRQPELENTAAKDAYSIARYQWLDCHGGVTYAQNYLTQCANGYWIGWDYAHLGDYDSTLYQAGVTGVQYTTREIVHDCQRVINQICARLSKNKIEKRAEEAAK